jgi:hypothetical protein
MGVSHRIDPVITPVTAFVRSLRFSCQRSAIQFLGIGSPIGPLQSNLKIPSLPENHLFIKYSLFILYCYRISPRVTAYLAHICVRNKPSACHHSSACMHGFFPQAQGSTCHHVPVRHRSSLLNSIDIWRMSQGLTPWLPLVTTTLRT